MAENPLDKTAIRSTAYETKAWLEQNGQTVSRIEIPEPGKHPHASQMATLLFLLEAFGMLALGLSGVLTANMISALLAQQIRQIGVMKAVGGRGSQVAVIYFGMVLFLGLLGLAVGMPLAVLAGRGYSEFASGMLNFQIFNNAIPAWAFILQAGVGLLIPLVAATFPILRGSRVTVRQAINDYGIAGTSGKQDFNSDLQSTLFSRPFLLSLRNTFRRRARLALTLVTLAAGGAGFIVAMNVLASMDSTVAARYDAARYDVQFSFSQPYPDEQVEEAIRSVNGVQMMESWGGAKAALVYPDGTRSNLYNLVAPPSTTQLMTDLPIIAGRWLRPDDTNALVVNHALLSKEPDLQIGSQVTLRIGGAEQTWQVVGVVQEIMSLPTAYTNQEAFVAATGLEGLTQNVVVVADDRSPETVAEVTRRLEAALIRRWAGRERQPAIGPGAPGDRRASAHPGVVLDHDVDPGFDGGRIGAGLDHEHQCAGAPARDRRAAGHRRFDRGGAAHHRGRGNDDWRAELGAGSCAGVADQPLCGDHLRHDVF